MDQGIVNWSHSKHSYEDSDYTIIMILLT